MAKIQQTYLSNQQAFVDLAKSSKFFNPDDYQQALSTDAGDAYLTIAYKAGSMETPETFDVNKYSFLTGADKIQYVYNHYLQDKNEIDKESGKNIYNQMNEYFDYKVDLAKSQKIYDSLSGFEKTINTIGGLAGDVGNAIYGLVDDITDALAWGLGTTLDWASFGIFHKDLSEGVRQALTTDWTGTETLQQGLENFKQNYTAFGVDDLGNARGNGLLTFVDDTVTAVAKMLPLAIPGVGAIAYGASMAGSVAEDAVETAPGVDLFNLSVYTTLMTGMEYGLEFLTAGFMTKIAKPLGKAFGKDFVGSSMDIIGSKMLGKTYKGAKGGIFKEIGMNFGTEFFEEASSEFLGSCLEKWLVNPERNLATLEEVLYAGLIGGVIGGGFGGVGYLSTSAGAINKETGEFSLWKDISEEDRKNWTKLTRNQTIDFRTSLGESVDNVYRDSLEDFYRKYNEEAGLTKEQAQEQHAREYSRAVKKSVKEQEKLISAGMVLSTILQQAGVQKFQNAVKFAEQTLEEQRALVRNYIEYTPNSEYRKAQLEAKMRMIYDDTSISIEDNLTAGQSKLAREFATENGIKVYFANFGQKNGVDENHSIVVDANTIVLDNALYKDTDKSKIANRVAKELLTEAMSERNDIMTIEKLNALRDIIQPDNYYTGDVKEDKKSFSKKEKQQLANLLIFDEQTITKCLFGDAEMFKDGYKFLTDIVAYLKTIKKTDVTKQEYNMALKALKLYQKVLSDNSPNEQYYDDAKGYVAKELRKDKSYSDETLQSFFGDRPFNGKSWKKFLFLPTDTNTQAVREMQAVNVLKNGLANPSAVGNNWIFDIYSPRELLSDEGAALFTPEFLQTIDYDPASPISFAEALNTYLLLNYGTAISTKPGTDLLVAMPIEEAFNSDVVEAMKNGIAVDYNNIVDLFSDKFKKTCLKYTNVNLDNVNVPIYMSAMENGNGYTNYNVKNTFNINKLNDVADIVEENFDEDTATMIMDSMFEFYTSNYGNATIDKTRFYEEFTLESVAYFTLTEQEAALLDSLFDQNRTYIAINKKLLENPEEGFYMTLTHEIQHALMIETTLNTAFYGESYGDIRNILADTNIESVGNWLYEKTQNQVLREKTKEFKNGVINRQEYTDNVAYFIYQSNPGELLAENRFEFIAGDWLNVSERDNKLYLESFNNKTGKTDRLFIKEATKDAGRSMDVTQPSKKSFKSVYAKEFEEIEDTLSEADDWKSDIDTLALTWLSDINKEYREKESAKKLSTEELERLESEKEQESKPWKYIRNLARRFNNKSDFLYALKGEKSPEKKIRADRSSNLFDDAQKREMELALRMEAAKNKETKITKTIVVEHKEKEETKKETTKKEKTLEDSTKVTAVFGKLFAFKQQTATIENQREQIEYQMQNDLKTFNKQLLGTAVMKNTQLKTIAYMIDDLDSVSNTRDYDLSETEKINNFDLLLARLWGNNEHIKTYEQAKNAEKILKSLMGSGENAKHLLGEIILKDIDINDETALESFAKELDKKFSESSDVFRETTLTSSKNEGEEKVNVSDLNAEDSEYFDEGYSEVILSKYKTLNPALGRFLSNSDFATDAENAEYLKKNREKFIEENDVTNEDIDKALILLKDPETLKKVEQKRLEKVKQKAQTIVESTAKQLQKNREKLKEKGYTEEELNLAEKMIQSKINNATGVASTSDLAIGLAKPTTSTQTLQSQRFGEITDEEYAVKTTEMWEKEKAPFLATITRENIKEVLDAIRVGQIYGFEKGKLLQWMYLKMSPELFKEFREEIDAVDALERTKDAQALAARNTGMSSHANPIGVLLKEIQEKNPDFTFSDARDFLVKYFKEFSDEEYRLSEIEKRMKSLSNNKRLAAEKRETKKMLLKETSRADQLDITNKNLEATNEKLKAQLEQAQQDAELIKEAQNKIADAETIENLKKELDKSKKDLTLAKQVLAGSKTSSDKQKQKIANLETSVKELEKKIKSYEDQSKKLELKNQDIKNLQKLIKSFETTMEQLKTSEEALKEKTDAQDKLIAELNAEVNRLNTETKESVAAEVEELQDELETTKSDLEKANSKIKSMEERYTKKLEKALADNKLLVDKKYKAEVDNLTKQLETLKNSNSALQEKMKSAKKAIDLQTYRNALNNNERIINELDAKLEKAQKTFAKEMEKKLNEQKVAFDKKLKGELNVKNAEIKRLKNTIKKQEQKLSQTQEKYAGYVDGKLLTQEQEKVEKLRLQIEMLETEIENTVTKDDAIISKLQQENEQLMSKIGISIKDFMKVKSRANRLEKTNNKHRRMLKKYQETIEALQTQTTQDAFEMQEMQDELNKLRMEYNLLLRKDYVGLLDLKMNELLESDTNRTENLQKVAEISKDVGQALVNSNPTTKTLYDLSGNSVMSPKARLKISNWLENLNSWRYLAMLSSPATWARNGVNNTLMSMNDYIVQGMAKSFWKINESNIPSGQLSYWGDYNQDFKDYVKETFGPYIKLRLGNGSQYEEQEYTRAKQEYAKAKSEATKAKWFNKLHDLEQKMLNDEKWTVKKSLVYLTDMLSGATDKFRNDNFVELKRLYAPEVKEITNEELYDLIKKTNPTLAELFKESISSSNPQKATIQLAITLKNDWLSVAESSDKNAGFIIEEAMRRSNKLFLKANNVISKKVNQLQNSDKAIDRATAATIKFFYPFIRMTVNTFGYIIDSSPIGAVNGMIDLFKLKVLSKSEKAQAIVDYCKQEYRNYLQANVDVKKLQNLDEKIAVLDKEIDRLKKVEGKEEKIRELIAEQKELTTEREVAAGMADSKDFDKEFEEWYTKNFDSEVISILSGNYKFADKVYEQMYANHPEKFSIAHTSTNPYLRARGIEKIARGVEGTAMMIIGATLAALTGAFDIDDDDDYFGPVLKIGDLKFKLEDLSPFSGMFIIGGLLVSDNVENKYGEIMNFIVDQSMLNLLESSLRYSNSLGDFATNQSISFTQQMIPTIVKQATKIIDNSKKDKSANNYFEKLFVTTLSNLPGFSYLVANKIDPYTGESVKQFESEIIVENILAMFLPVNVRYEKSSELEKIATELDAKTSGFSGSYEFNDEKVKVTQKDKERISKFRANYIASQFELINSDKQFVTVKDDNGKMLTTKFSKLNDKQKQNVLNNLYSKAGTYSKVEYWTSNGGTYITNSSTELYNLKKVISNPQNVKLGKAVEYK